MTTSLLTPPKMEFLLKYLHLALAFHGDVAEVGIYQGGTLAHMASLYPDRQFVGYDTFEGLPEAGAADVLCVAPHKKGDFADVDFGTIKRRMPKNVALVKGLFPHSAMTEHPMRNFCFVHLDVDFYWGTYDALTYLSTSMPKGGVIVVDDYQWHRTPGVKKAVDDFKYDEPSYFEILAIAEHQIALGKL